MEAGAESLIERERELAALAEAIDAGNVGRGGLALLQAGPGLGKSALCAAARELGTAGGMEVMSATSGPLDRDLPFGVARKLFDRRIARADPHEREALLGGAAGLAAPLFEAGAGPLAEREHAGLVYGLYWLAVNCSESRPLLLVVDDAHGADSASLDFLVYLARRIEGLPVALVVATRAFESGADAQLLERLRASAGEARVLSPARLSENGVARAVREHGWVDAEDDLCEACATATDGNPLLLVELLRGLRAEGLHAGNAATRVASLTPRLVLRAALERLALLPRSAGCVARAASVLGEDANLRRVALLSEMELSEAAAASDRLRAAELAVDSAGEGISIAHPLVNEAIYDAIPTGERALMHARAARILDADGESVERVAAQLLRACRGGDAWAVQQLVAAAREARARGAHATAAERLARALQEPPSAGEREGVLYELGCAQAAAHMPEAIGTLELAAEQLDEPSQRARALGELGRARFAAGDLAGAARAFERGIEELGEDDREGPLGRELEARYVAAATGTTEVSARDRARLDRLVSDRLHDGLPAERAVMAAVALRGALTGEPAERVRELALGALAGDGAAAASPGDQLDLIAATIALLYTDELDGCKDALRRALDDARRTGSVAAFGTVCNLRAWPLYLAGELSDAIADAERGLEEMSEGAYRPYGATYTLLVHAKIEVGDLEGAAETVAAAESRARTDGGDFVIPHAARGRLKLVLGDARGALEDLQRQGELLAQLGYANYPIPWRPTAALAALALGNRGHAKRLAEEELEMAERVGSNRGLGVALRAAGLVEGGAEGVKLLERAVGALESSPSALERARALVDLGALRRRTGQRAAAREPLRRGLELAHTFGAAPLLEQASAELLAAGGRPRRIQLSGVDALTPSERRIARMAANGLTNPQIAQALFVTRKTVEFHLGNAYSKLGIGSRADLRQALEANK